MNNSSQKSSDLTGAAKLRKHQILYSIGIAVALSLAWGAATYATHLPGTASKLARVASYIILAIYVVWMFVIIWLRDSKGRWLSLAIIIQWVGVAMVYLSGVEMPLPNGKCTNVLEIGKAFELAGLFFGLTATIWLAAGAWLTSADVRGMDKIAKEGKWRQFVGGLLKSAHNQIALGLVTAILGALLTACSAGWDFYSKLKGVEIPKEHECSAEIKT
jgi:hypothetical protein